MRHGQNLIQFHAHTSRSQIVRIESEGREVKKEVQDFKEAARSAKKEADAAAAREASAKRELEDAVRDVRRLQEALQEEREQHAEVG